MRKKRGTHGIIVCYCVNEYLQILEREIDANRVLHTNCTRRQQKIAAVRNANSPIRYLL